jgi:hypothetical protein
MIFFGGLFLVGYGDGDEFVTEECVFLALKPMAWLVEYNDRIPSSMAAMKTNASF